MRRLALATSLSLLVACQPASHSPAAVDAKTPAVAQAPAAFAFEEADIASLQKQMGDGSLTSKSLTQAYLDCGAAQNTRFGAASCILCDAAGLFRVTRHVLAPDPECIVTAPSIPAERWAGFHA